MSTKIGVGLLTLLLVVYLVLAGQKAVVLLLTGEPLPMLMGAALLVLPLLGAWALVRELRFGIQAERLGRRLDEAGELPQDELPVLASGRIERDAADAIFPRYRSAVEANPDDWRAWYRLGLVYDAAGDRRRARSAIRTAISLAATPATS